MRKSSVINHRKFLPAYLFPFGVPVLRMLAGKMLAVRLLVLGMFAVLFVEGQNVTGSERFLRRLDGSKISNVQLTERINRLMDTAKVTGLSITVFNKNKPVYTGTFGYADVTTGQKLDSAAIWWSCSFSKAVFAYYAMKLVDKGVLNLDTPLVHYLNKPLYEYTFTKKSRGYKDIKEDKRFEKITARMCLDHTTGLPNYRGYEPDGKLRIHADPGTRYSYSGEGIYLLQFVLEQITGKDFENSIQEEVLRPLGMVHSSYIWQPAFDGNHCVGHDSLQHAYVFDARTVSHAAGSLYTTIGDFSLFYEALLNQRGLSAKSFRELFRPQIPILSKQQFGPNARVDERDEKTTSLFYGLGFGLIKTPYGTAFFKEGHSEGWGHYSIGFPDKGIAVIIMTNSDQGESIFKELLQTAIGDSYTPWFWDNYIPYNIKKAP
ncbi:serine hydrolase domain-containing protein [Flavitalea flava]